MSPEPKSLQEAVVYFSDPNNCIDYLAIRRWPDGRVICPTCGSDSVKFNAERRWWQCASHHPKRQFSIKVGTIMEDSAIPLDKWLMAMWMVTNCKNGISSYEIAKDVKVTQKSAWFMLHRIRLAMQDETFGSKLGGRSGEVEADETFIRGKARNMHLNVKTRRRPRPGHVRTQVIPDRQKTTLQPIVKEHVHAGSDLPPAFVHVRIRQISAAPCPV